MTGQWTKYREAGLCGGCGKTPERGRTLCPACRDKNKERQANLVNRRREAGLCAQCGTHRVEVKGEDYYCKKCREEHSEKTAERHRKEMERLAKLKLKDRKKVRN